MRTNPALWILWVVATLAIGGYFAWLVFVDADKQGLLVGTASHGHFQIEMDCNACHTEPFANEGVLQQACVGCHGKELELAHDSHPRSKFTDPRNVDLLAGIDARLCVSCHTEHQAERTLAMGVTLPGDFCVNCHQEIATERPSHAGLSFTGCASAGCHNYHDNQALYEDFLYANALGDWLRTAAALPTPNAAAQIAVASAAQAMGGGAADPRAANYHATSHGKAGVGCAGCHEVQAGDSAAAWIDNPGIEQCQGCHRQEAGGFLAGKHGARLASGLDPLMLGTSPLAFADPLRPSHQSCAGCHGAHDFDTGYAATEACLGCHADEHSRAFTASPHGQLAAKATRGEIPAAQTLSCASCHMPRVVDESAPDIVRVQHNQNDNLRPNEKMIRPVCMQCHSLAFSIDALADPELIRSNFSGQPSRHIPSVDWAVENR